MAAGATYEPIATNTLVSATGSVTFSSIPGTYTDLVLISNIKSNNTNNSSLLFEINGSNSGSLYSGTMIYGTGSVYGSNRVVNQDFGYIMRNGGLSVSGTVIQPFITYINNYTNTAKYRTVLSRNNVADTNVGADSALWRSTAAVTSFRIFAGTNDFAVGSSFTLYGIAAA
jgi:hypothetical protein